jgi:hypothetical protein
VNRSEALFVAGWLATRLGWEPVDPTYELIHSEKGDDLPPSARLSLKVGKRAITVLINSGPWRSENVPGEVCSITLEAFGDGGLNKDDVAATFSIAQSDKADEAAWMRVEVKGKEPMVRHVQIEPLGRAELLDAELEVFSRDRVYDEALEMVGTFIRGVDASAKPQPETRKITTGEPISAGVVRPRHQEGGGGGTAP